MFNHRFRRVKIELQVASLMHAIEFLRRRERFAEHSLLVLSGDQRTLKQHVIENVAAVLLGEDVETSLIRFNGPDVDLATVRDELATRSMWGDRRVVVVEDAEDFVSKNRAALEGVFEKPPQKGTLILDVKTWSKATRLAKLGAKLNAEVDCGALKGAALRKWLTDYVRDAYHKAIDREAAELLIELVGDQCGMLEQELDKLASFVGERETITLEDVTQLVGGWRTETTWAMVDAVRDGNVRQALYCLESLLTAGEAPLRILGGLGFTFRKLAYAAELVEQRRPLEASLAEAGVFTRDIARSAQYLKRIGKVRAERLGRWLLEAEHGLKGGSPLPDRAQIELLLLRLAGAK